MTAWALALCLAAPGDLFRLKLVVEEAGVTTSFFADFRPGAIRIEPEGENIFLLLETADPASPESTAGKPRLTLVQTEERFFCRMSPSEFRRLAKVGLVRPEWCFWPSPVSADLLEDTTLEPVDRRHFRVRSRKYACVVAEYEIDPKTPPALFFQWRESYPAFFPEAEADRKRFDLYERLPGLPLVMRERFEFLTRERVLRVVSRAPSSQEAFTWPMDFAEKTASDLFRDALMKRLREWLRRSEAPRK